MSKSKRIDLICMVTAVFMVLVTVLFLGGGRRRRYALCVQNF